MPLTKSCQQNIWKNFYFIAVLQLLNKLRRKQRNSPMSYAEMRTGFSLLLRTNRAKVLPNFRDSWIERFFDFNRIWLNRLTLCTYFFSFILIESVYKIMKLATWHCNAIAYFSLWSEISSLENLFVQSVTKLLSHICTCSEIFSESKVCLHMVTLLLLLTKKKSRHIINEYT